jgi:hypothetical protein
MWTNKKNRRKEALKIRINMYEFSCRKKENTIVRNICESHKRKMKCSRVDYQA